MSSHFLVRCVCVYRFTWYIRHILRKIIESRDVVFVLYHHRASIGFIPRAACDRTLSRWHLTCIYIYNYHRNLLKEKGPASYFTRRMLLPLLALFYYNEKPHITFFFSAGLLVIRKGTSHDLLWCNPNGIFSFFREGFKKEKKNPFINSGGEKEEQRSQPSNAFSSGYIPLVKPAWGIFNLFFRHSIRVSRWGQQDDTRLVFFDLRQEFKLHHLTEWTDGVSWWTPGDLCFVKSWFHNIFPALLFLI